MSHFFFLKGNSFKKIFSHSFFDIWVSFCCLTPRQSAIMRYLSVLVRHLLIRVFAQTVNGDLDMVVGGFTKFCRDQFFCLDIQICWAQISWTWWVHAIFATEGCIVMFTTFGRVFENSFRYFLFVAKVSFFHLVMRDIWMHFRKQFSLFFFN